MHDNADFLAGVIEGFYGPPWSPAERFTLFAWMRGWELSTYLCAPKDDLKHRALWREPYNAAAAEAVAELLRAARLRSVDSPHFPGPWEGLDEVRLAAV